MVAGQLLVRADESVPPERRDYRKIGLYLRIH